MTGKRLVWLLLFSLLASCGFKLRGFADLPDWLNNIAIVKKEAHQDLLPVLRDQLQAYRIRVLDNPIEADYLLILENDNFQQQITGVSASTTPRQYRLIYTLNYSLVNKKFNKTPISTGRVVVIRQFTRNNDRILGSDYEENLILTEMHRDAALQVISRISKK